MNAVLSGFTAKLQSLWKREDESGGPVPVRDCTTRSFPVKPLKRANGNRSCFHSGPTSKVCSAAGRPRWCTLTLNVRGAPRAQNESSVFDEWSTGCQGRCPGENIAPAHV